eukprot:4631704-Pyramimonas_sp.AAC.1
MRVVPARRLPLAVLRRLKRSLSLVLQHLDVSHFGHEGGVVLGSHWSPRFQEGRLALRRFVHVGELRMHKHDSETL